MNAEGRELLSRLRDLSPRRVENFSDKIRLLAKRVKVKLDDVLDLVDPRQLVASEDLIKELEKLKCQTEEAMSSRRKLEAGAMAGNVMQIGGNLACAHPIGKAVFLAGAVASSVCDALAYKKQSDVDNIARDFNQRLQNWRDAFRPVAGAVRRLDETFKEGTGKSLYDKELPAFIRTAEKEGSDRVVLPCTVTNEEHKRNLIEIARNRDLMALLRSILDAISRRDVVILRFAVQVTTFLSFVQTCPEYAVALQGGVLILRGINMFLQYKDDKAMLQNMADEIESIRKTLVVLTEHI